MNAMNEQLAPLWAQAAASRAVLMALLRTHPAKGDVLALLRESSAASATLTGAADPASMLAAEGAQAAFDQALLPYVRALST